MPLDLTDYERLTREAVKAFWGNRTAAAKKQEQLGQSDQGTRGSVTAGKNMDGFIVLVQELIRANGLVDTDMIINGPLDLTLPGYFRPTKRWDLLVIRKKRLIAALELKSQVGSFGNNYNNRTEEAIGTAVDLWTAYREGAFGEAPRPFLGWLMLAEDAPGSRRSVKDRSKHFAMFPEFKNASYLERYNHLCRRLVHERLYSSATILASPQSAATTGDFTELSKLTGLRAFVTCFAAHIAAEAVS